MNCFMGWSGDDDARAGACRARFTREFIRTHGPANRKWIWWYQGRERALRRGRASRAQPVGSRRLTLAVRHEEKREPILKEDFKSSKIGLIIRHDCYKIAERSQVDPCSIDLVLIEVPRIRDAERQCELPAGRRTLDDPKE